MRRCTSLLMLFGFLFTPVWSTAAEPRGIASFHGVTPGITTASQVQDNRAWGILKRSEEHPPHVHWFYQVKPWESVVAIIDKEDVVQAIELVPPASFDELERIATGLGVGPFESVASFPQGAKRGTPPTPGSVTLFSEVSHVAAIVQETDGQKHVERIRFYAPEQILSGIAPGKTTLNEVTKSKGWGPPGKRLPLIGEALLVEYYRPGWNKVTLTVEGGIVWSIDAVPPEWTDPDEFAAKLNLGEKNTPETAGKDAERTPPWSRLAPSDPPDTTVIEYPEKMAVMFIAEHKGTEVVELLRFYTDVPERHSYFGTHMRTPSTPSLAKLGFPPGVGVTVIRVEPGSPAFASSIQRDDILLKVDDREITSVQEMVALIRVMTPGSTHDVLVGRDDKLITRPVTLAPAPLSQSFLNRAIDAKARNDLTAAIQDLSQCLRLVPDQVSAYSMRGQCRRDKQDFDGAIEDYTQAIRYDENMASLYVMRANVLMKKSDHDAAMRDYNRGIQLDPNEPTAYFGRAILHGTLNRYDLALEDCNKGITLTPELPNGYKNRAFVHRHLGNEELVAADLRKAKELEAAAQAKDAATVGNRRSRAAILEIDRKLQKQSVSQRTNKVLELQRQAITTLQNGAPENAAVSYWNARQLTVVKTIPTLSWTRFDMEVTDRAAEGRVLGGFVRVFEKNDHDRYFAGIRVRRVLPGGKAAGAGLLAGDRIVAFGQESVTSARQFEQLVMTHFQSAQRVPVSERPTVRLTVRGFDGQDRLVSLSE